MKIQNLSFAVLALIAFSGCQTPHVFPTPGRNWVTYNGQLRYSTADRSVIGGAVVSFVPVHYFQLDFFAGPGFPLMKLRENRTFARVEGSLARGSWEGEAGSAPRRLRSWFMLHEVFNTLATRHRDAKPVRFESLTPGVWEATVTSAGGRPAKLDIHIPSTGERFLFHFQVPG